MEAPFWFLGDRAVRGTSFTGEASVQTNIIGAFSLPRKAQRQRGYVSYCAEELTDGCIIDSWFDYTHRDSPFLYPNRSAMDHKISGIWDLKNRFPEVQTSVQFYPFREGDVLFGYEDSRS